MRFCLLGFAGWIASLIAASADPLDEWTLRYEEGGDPALLLTGVTFGNDIFVAVGARRSAEFPFSPNTQTILYSFNAINWTEAPPPAGRLFPTGTAFSIAGVTYADGKFVAVGVNPQISLNGTEWSVVLSASAQRDVVYGEGVFVSVGPYYDGTIPLAVSSDGRFWRSIKPPTPVYEWFSAVAFGSGRFVAVGWSGNIIVSTNSTNWEQVPSGTAAILNGVVYGNGQYVAVGDKGTVLVSPDGEAWWSADSGTTNRLQGIAYGGGNFVAVGANGTILTSPDTKAWKARESGTTNELYRVIYGRDTFVAVGAGGTILQSGVEPFTLRFDRVQVHPEGVEVHLVGEAGRAFRVEASTNLVDWTEVSVSAGIEDGLLLLDAAPATLPRKFYRAVAP